MAVCVLSVLIVLFAVGTIYESLYGAFHAQEMIYRSTVMTVALSLLFLNILAVMLDRLPWRKKHIPFLMAHIGILAVIIGAFLTRMYGVDGSLRLALGEKGSYIHTSNEMLLVYSSFDAQNMAELYREKVSFFRHKPSIKKPYSARLGSEVLKVIDYHPAVLSRQGYAPALRGGQALRFQIEGSRLNVVKWLFKPPLLEKALISLGPAQVVLVDSFDKFHGALPLPLQKPSLVLKQAGEGLEYKLIGAGKNHSVLASPKPAGKGRGMKYKQIMFGGSGQVVSGSGGSFQKSNKKILKKGSVLKTGWMDFQFRVLDYLPKALPSLHFTPQKRPGENTTSAVYLDFKGEKKWLALNSFMYFFDENKVFVTAYVNERIPLPFQLKLKNFQVVRYPSSNKAVHYESEVWVDNKKEVFKISMNEPLKFAGFTIYQSGFEEDDQSGRPEASIFAINKDPGRFLKYGGSLLVILGAFLLFLKRNRRWFKKADVLGGSLQNC